MTQHIATIQPNWQPKPPHIQAHTTLRQGGVSAGCYQSLNLGAKPKGDSPDLVAENQRRLSETLKLPAPPHWLKQQHSSRVLLMPQKDIEEADGAYTTEPNTVLVARTADCLPIVITNVQGNELAVLHAGWRGLHRGIVSTALSFFQSSAAELMVWIGPGISQTKYEVQKDVFEAFTSLATELKRCFKHTDETHWLLDIKDIAVWQLQQAGLEHIFISPHCTYSEPERFFSFRRDGLTGNIATLAWIEPTS